MTDLFVARRYRLGRRIGTGGMGRVWLAMDEVLRREVAVKEVLLPEGLSDDDAAEVRLRTLREARTAGKVSHPNVIKVYDVIYAENRPWIVMEYVESRSLAQALREDGPMSPEETARVGLAVLSALVAAHEAGVLHRDVKPGNVLIGTKRVVLTDFGLATFDDIGSALTASGVVHGSPQFIAPERALDGTSTVAADMWSLGATLYAAVEGRAPYARASSYATLTALATAPPDPPKRAGALKPVLHGLLRRNPDARMNADEVRAWLERIADDADGDESSRSRIPRQRGTDPDSSGGSGSNSARGAAAGRSAAVAPISHARRHRRPTAAAAFPRATSAAPTATPPTGKAPTAKPPNGKPPTGKAPTGKASTAQTTTAKPPTEKPASNGSTLYTSGAAKGFPSAGGPPAATERPPAATASKQAAFVHPPGEVGHDTDEEMDAAWQLDARSGLLGEDAASAARTRADADAARRTRRRRQLRFARWLAAVVCVMAAAAGGAVAIRHWREPAKTPTTLSPPVGSGSNAASADPNAGAAPVGSVIWPCATTQPSSHLHAVQQTNRVVAGKGHPNNYTWVTIDGLNVIAPAGGWVVAAKGSVTCFYSLGNTYVIGYSAWTASQTSATAELTARLGAFRQNGHWTNYAQQHISSYLIQPNDATLEFTYTAKIRGVITPMQGLIYLVRSSTGEAYALFFASDQQSWSGRQADLSIIESSMYSVNENILK